MSSRIHIEFGNVKTGFRHSYCHYQAHNVLVPIDKFAEVVQIVPEVCCKACKETLSRIGRDSRFRDLYDKELGMFLLKNIGK